MEFTAGQLFASLFVSTIGLGFFLYGKKQARFPQLIVGMALIGFPYFVSDTYWMLGTAALLVVGLWLALRAGL